MSICGFFADGMLGEYMYNAAADDESILVGIEEPIRKLRNSRSRLES